MTAEHLAQTQTEAYAELEALAAWTRWVSFEEAARSIDRLPGVYLMRKDDQIVYVGKAGERAGTTGRPPAGMRGRIARYYSGKAATSGFGEAALDRALADVHFVENQLATLRASGPRRVTEWARDAVAWHNVDMQWTVCPDSVSAGHLEDDVVTLLRPHGIWNR